MYPRFQTQEANIAQELNRSEQTKTISHAYHLKQ